MELNVIEDHKNITKTGVEENIELEKIDDNCTVHLESLNGYVHIRQKIEQHCSVTIKARTGVFVAEKIDQHCNVIIETGGAVVIAGKIDRHCSVMVRATGPIIISEKIDGSSDVTLITEGDIAVGHKIDGNAVVKYRAARIYTGNEGLRPGSQLIEVPGDGVKAA